MKKRNLTAIIVLLIIIFSAPLFAQNRIIDDAGLLSPDSKAGLERRLQEIASAHNFDFIILTKETIGSADPIDYSWSYLDGRGLGGYEWDGCLLLITSRDRDYAFTASGRGEKILNNAAYDKLEKDVLLYLKENNFAGAFNAFAKTWEEFLVLDSQGRRYNLLRDPTTHLIWIAVAWVLAFLIGHMVVRTMKMQMNTAIAKSLADTYVVPGSLNFTRQSDRFLYSTTVRVKNESSSSSGGGSSRSGGGRSSRSGKF